MYAIRSYYELKKYKSFKNLNLIISFTNTRHILSYLVNLSHIDIYMKKKDEIRRVRI